MSELRTYNDAVEIKAKNRRLSIVKSNEHPINLIYITSLTNDTGLEPGCLHKLSDNQKVKYSLIGLSDDAIKDLHVCLGRYLEHVL